MDCAKQTGVLQLLPNTAPKFLTRPTSEDTIQKIDRSFRECAKLTERSLKCPYCTFVLDGIFSDASGHIRIKCPKCKAVMVLNLAYFRRRRPSNFLYTPQRKHLR